MPERSPLLTIPNILTIARLVAVPFFVFVSLRGWFRLAFVLFVGAALTDIFDGMIARRLNQRSRLGAILDPAADKTMMVSGYLVYTLHSAVGTRLPGWLTFTVMIRDVVIVVFAYLLYTRIAVKRFPPSWAGKASTLLQAVTLATVIAVNAFGPRYFEPLMFVFLRLTLGMTLYSSWDYLRRGQELLAAHTDAADR